MSELNSRLDVINTETSEDDFLEDESGLEINEENNSLSIYPNVEVRVSRAQFSVLHVKRMYEQRRELIIDPNFQRGNVWQGKQRSELIESILMGLPIPEMYFFETKEGCKQVVDGRQRITTIMDFLNDRFRLNDLKILRNYNKFKFSELDKKSQGIIEDYQFSVNVIQPPTPERVKYDIFDRVNRGGTRLNNQEMRNALYIGKATEVVSAISNSNAFLKATEGKVNKVRMKDQYIILRAVSFFLWVNGDLQAKNGSESIEYKSDIDDFLAKVMIAVNSQLDEAVVSNATNRILLSMERIHSILGTDAFRFKPKENGKRRPINMLLFEVLAYLFTFDDVEKDREVTKILIDNWKEQMDETGSSFRESVDSTPSVIARFIEVERLVEQIRIL